MKKKSHVEAPTTASDTGAFEKGRETLSLA